MTQLNALYRRVTALADPSVAHALAAALPTAQGEAQSLLVDQLLLRNTLEGNAALIQYYHLLPHDLQPNVAKHLTACIGPLRAALARTDAHSRANVLAIIRLHGSPDLAYLPAEVLRNGHVELHTPAAATLLTLTLQVFNEFENPDETPAPRMAAKQAPRSNLAAANSQALAPLPLQAGQIQAALGDALASFPRHRQRAILLSLMHLAPHPLTARADFSDPRSPVVTATRFLLSGAGHAATRRALPCAMLVPTLRQAALAGLQSHQATPAFADVYAHGHILTHPAVKTALASCPQPHQLLPDAPAIARMPAQTQRFLPAWIAALPLPSGDKARLLGQLGQARAANPAAQPSAQVSKSPKSAGPTPSLPPPNPPLSVTIPPSSTTYHPHPQTRFSALRQLIALDVMPGPVSPRTIIATFLDDPESAIACVALRHLLRVAWDGLPRTLARLVNSPHATVRHLAGQRLAPLAFTKLWDAWPQMPEDRQLIAGRAMLKLNAEFVHHLADKLALPQRAVRLRAIAMIHTLNQGPFFEQALLALAAGPDEVVAATAVRALGAIASPATLAALETALHHEDARVRANAIEALEHVKSVRHVQQLMSIARDDVGRPRANAIKALFAMRTRDALSALATMLQDTQPEHRLSALWLVETMGLLDVARQVAEMSLTDPEPRVKARADRVITRLLAA